LEQGKHPHRQSRVLLGVVVAGYRGTTKHHSVEQERSVAVSNQLGRVATIIEIPVLDEKMNFIRRLPQGEAGLRLPRLPSASYSHMPADRMCNDLQQPERQHSQQQQQQQQQQQPTSEVMCPRGDTQRCAVQPSQILAIKVREHGCWNQNRPKCEQSTYQLWMQRCSCNGHFLQEYARLSGKRAKNVASVVLFSCWLLCQLALLALCWFWRLSRQQKVPIISELLVFSASAIGLTLTVARPDILEWPGPCNASACVSSSVLVGGSAIGFGALLNCRAFFEIPLM